MITTVYNQSTLFGGYG